MLICLSSSRSESDVATVMFILGTGRRRCCSQFSLSLYSRCGQPGEDRSCWSLHDKNTLMVRAKRPHEQRILIALVASVISIVQSRRIRATENTVVFWSSIHYLIVLLERVTLLRRTFTHGVWWCNFSPQTHKVVQCDHDISGAVQVSSGEIQFTTGITCWLLHFFSDRLWLVFRYHNLTAVKIVSLQNIKLMYLIMHFLRIYIMHYT